MRYLALLFLLFVGCFVHKRTPGLCLVQGDRIVQIQHTRGLTMVYLRLWDPELAGGWSGPYPADTWTLIGLDTVECPKWKM